MQKYNKLLLYIMGIAFAIMLIVLISESDSFILNIALYIVLTVDILIIIRSIICKSNNIFIKKICTSIEFIIALIISGSYLFTGVFNIIIPWIVIWGLSIILTTLLLSLKTSLYISIVITLCFMSYGCNYVFKKFKHIIVEDSILNGLVYSRSIIFYSKIPLRKIVYFISIMFYVIAKCVELESVSISNEYLLALLEIANEVLITYISIDSLIMTFYGDILKNNEESIKELGEKLEKEYSERFELLFNKKNI